MKRINETQTELYEQYEVHGSRRQFEIYRDVLDKYCCSGRTIRILDIGGASGSFAYLIKSGYPQSDIEVYVIDSVEYEQWEIEPFKSNIHFVCDSVENLANRFEEETFDVIFANRVFHHFVDKDYRTTIRGIQHTMEMVCSIIKKDGIFCIMDELCDGRIIDSSTSYLIYRLTSIRNPVLSKFMLKMGAMSAGVGVCFLSEKMWTDYLDRSGFCIIDIKRSNLHKLRSIKKYALLNKNHTRDNYIFAVRK